MRLLVVSLLAFGGVAASACGGAAPAPTKTPGDAPTGSAKTEDRAVRARTELDDGERSLDATTSECGSACKALASMERAQAALCEVGTPKECEDAKARVEKARAKVKGAGCSCPAAAP